MTAIQKAQPNQNAALRKEDAVTILGGQEMQRQLMAALPKHLTPERMLRLVTTELRKNPALGKCDPWSIVACVVQVAQLGLEPGSGLGHAYLVPYKDECTLIIGYKGLAELARRSGEIKSINAFAVYKDDYFFEGIRDGDYKIEWTPSENEGRDEKDCVAFIAMAKFANGSTQSVVMRRWEVERIRSGLRYVSKVWVEHFIEMGKKTAIRRLMKLCPQAAQFVQALGIEDAHDDGKQFRHNAQPLIEIGAISESYVAEHEERALKEKGAELRKAPDSAPPVETPAEKEAKQLTRGAALAEFDGVYAKAKANGLKLGDALKMLGVEADKVRNGPVDEINAASDILGAWLKDRGIS